MLLFRWRCGSLEDTEFAHKERLALLVTRYLQVTPRLAQREHTISWEQ